MLHEHELESNLIRFSVLLGCVKHLLELWVFLAALLPQRSRNSCRIDTLLPPPGLFVAGMMQVAVMRRAERHGELVGDLAAHGVGLGEGQVMGLGAVPDADDAAVADDEIQVVGVAQPLDYCVRPDAD